MGICVGTLPAFPTHLHLSYDSTEPPENVSIYREARKGCNMRLSKSTAASALIAAIAAVCLVASSAPAQAANPSYLSTVQAVAGSTVLGQTSKGEDERFTLTMRGVDPVTKFADRPLRAASVISPAALVSNWNSWFADSPPNAVLTFAGRAGEAPQSIVVTLTKPRYERPDTH